MQIELGRPGGKQQKYQNQKISLPTGYPGNFYSNAIESTHKKFKTYIKQDKMDNQISGMINPKCSWTEAALKYVEMIAVHHRNLERALMDEGNWICITIST